MSNFQQFVMALLDGCLFIPLTILPLCLPWRTVAVVKGLMHEHQQGEPGQVNGNLRGHVIMVGLASPSGPIFRTNAILITRLTMSSLSSISSATLLRVVRPISLAVLFGRPLHWHSHVSIGGRNPKGLCSCHHTLSCVWLHPLIVITLAFTSIGYVSGST
jgi:hypothetical protein